MAEEEGREAAEAKGGDGRSRAGLTGAGMDVRWRAETSGAGAQRKSEGPLRV